jgi:EpsD family peptidyl-prolyl cis-trans isomerase
MTIPFPSRSRHQRPSGAARVVAVSLVASVAFLAGCDKNKEKAATQTAAKVNKEEITVHQINYVLSQQRPPLPPEQAASANRAILERLIDQELTLQKAADQKLDRDPRVVQQIDAARREIVSRAYLDKIGEGAPKPTPAEVAAYYEAHPALFKERRVYSLQEVNIDAPPQQVEELKKVLVGSKTFPDFVSYLKANNVRFTGGEAVRAAEQLPLASVDQFGKMKDGQAIFNVRPGGAQVINLAASRPQAVTLQQAMPAIEQFLLNERKRKLIADDLQALRSSAKIEYMGQFAADAARSPYRPASVPDLPPLTTMPATLPASEVKAAPQVDVPIESNAASAPSASTLDRGLKGFK